MEKKKKDELQNRREFFKSAAKGALPILGAILFAGVPNVLKAAEKEPMGCSNGCWYSCYGTCKSYCEGACKGTCTAYCNGSCAGGCKVSCYTSCVNVSY